MNNYIRYNPKIHHRKSVRLQGFDYSKAGLYFITICCQNRECLFGEITDGKMILNNGGRMADECWQEIPNHFPNAKLHQYIVMPNHIHGIIELTDDENVGAENFLPLQTNHNQFQKMIPRSISSIVKGFKIGVTKWFRAHTHIKEVWQRNYHEHIIRNEKSHQTITDYIKQNPKNWEDDKFYIKYVSNQLHS